ncbi:MAG: hypothetical protein AAB768_01530 [Patescibacteria group bacterium]
MNWEQAKSSPATRGFVTVARGAVDFGGFLLKVTFKPVFMSHAQNPEYKLGDGTKLQFLRLLPPFYMALLSGARLGEWNGQLNPQNVIFTLGIAFLGSGLVDIAGIGLQAIGEMKEE